jgi:hypothetical protein
MLMIIDRFEDEYVVIEWGEITFDIPSELLPPYAKEGDVLDMKISIDHEITKIRKQEADKLLQELLKGEDETE